VHQLVAVLLPERFRGGCAFGSGAANHPDLSRESWARDGGRVGRSQGGGRLFLPPRVNDPKQVGGDHHHFLSLEGFCNLNGTMGVRILVRTDGTSEQSL